MNAAHALATYAKRRAEIEAGAVKPERIYSVVRDDRQSGWFDPGYAIRNDQTGVLMNDEPIETEAKANRFLEELEERRT